MIWAAFSKGPGYSPENLVAEIRRKARNRADEYEALDMAAPVDAGDVSRRLRAALEDAAAFALAVPSGKEGLLFPQHGQPGQPDPRCLDAYVERAGRRHAPLPDSAEIGSAMLQRYGKPSA